MPKNEVSNEGNVGGELKEGRTVDHESVIEESETDEAMDKDAERDIPSTETPKKPDPRAATENGQPQPDLGEQHGELINDGEGESEKSKQPRTDSVQPSPPKRSRRGDEGDIDPDIRRDVESGKENVA